MTLPKMYSSIEKRIISGWFPIVWQIAREKFWLQSFRILFKSMFTEIVDHLIAQKVATMILVSYTILHSANKFPKHY